MRGQRESRRPQIPKDRAARLLKLPSQLPLKPASSSGAKASLKPAGIARAIHAHADAGARHQRAVSAEITMIWMTGFVPSEYASKSTSMDTMSGPSTCG